MNSKFRIISCILISFLIFGAFSVVEQAEEDDQQDTTISFRIEQQDEQEEDYIEVEVTIVTKDSGSLVSALSQSEKKVQAVNNAVTRYCENDEKEKDCEQAVEIEQNVDPKYHEVKKQQVFQGFQVTNTLTITINNPEGIGKLMDQVLKCGISKIESFTWKAQEEKDNNRVAIKEAISQAKLLCKALNMKFKQILSLEQIQQEEQQAEQGEEPETPPIVFEVKASCQEDENATQDQQADQGDEDQQENDGEQADQEQQVVPEPPKPKKEVQTKPKKQAQPKQKAEKVEKPTEKPKVAAKPNDSANQGKQKASPKPKAKSA